MSYRIREVAERANVPEGFVRRLISVGALPREEAGLGTREVRRARLLQSWEAAGLSVESIVTLIDRGALSLTFLDAPVMETPERLDRSYEELAADRGVAVALLQALHQAIGFAPPDPGDRAGEDDLTMLDVAEMFRGAGADDEATLRLLAVYADGLRRIAKAEADLYEANIERRLRATGLDERRLTEERGDEVAAIAGLDVVERTTAVDLPPAHVGIHTGPVISQDGDVYGRTVNLAARIASHARAGLVIVSEETAHRSDRHELRLEPLGPIEPKGVAKPLPLYQAFRK